MRAEMPGVVVRELPRGDGFAGEREQVSAGRVVERQVGRKQAGAHEYCRHVVEGLAAVLECEGEEHIAEFFLSQLRRVDTSRPTDDDPGGEDVEHRDRADGNV